MVTSEDKKEKLPIKNDEEEGGLFHDPFLDNSQRKSLASAFNKIFLSFVNSLA